MKNKIYNYAIKLLSIKIRTKKNLQEKLEQKFPSETNNILTCIKILEDKKYINDEEFASTYIRYRLETSPQGKNKLKKELMQKGIDYEQAQKSIEESEIEEEKYAKLLADKKVKTYPASYDQNKIYQKLSFYLTTRGFQYSTIRSVMNKILDLESKK